MYYWVKLETLRKEVAFESRKENGHSGRDQ